MSFAATKLAGFFETQLKWTRIYEISYIPTKITEIYSYVYVFFFLFLRWYIYACDINGGVDIFCCQLKFYQYL